MSKLEEGSTPPSTSALVIGENAIPDWASVHFHGTWQVYVDRSLIFPREVKRSDDELRLTNVTLLYDAMPQPRLQLRGLGKRKGKVGLGFGGAFGAGVDDRVEQAIEWLRSQPAQRYMLTGHSRGAATVMKTLFALEHEREKFRRRGLEPPTWTKISAVVLVDPVASFGLDAIWKSFVPERIRRYFNIDFQQIMPTVASRCLAIYALDERRPAFRPTLVLGAGVDRVWLEGGHADVGGYGDPELADVAGAVTRAWLCEHWPDLRDRVRFPEGWKKEPPPVRVPAARVSRNRSVWKDDVALLRAMV